MGLILSKKRDPATEQAAAGIPAIKEMGTDFLFTAEEKTVLRELAKKVAELAARPEEERKAKLWTAHNDLKTAEPVVFVDPENGWNEIIHAEDLKCHDPLARVWEMQLRKLIYWAEDMKDDKVIERYFDVPYSYFDSGWGVHIDKHGGEDNGAYKVEPAIKEYEDDFEKVHFPEITIDWEESNKVMELAQELFGDILEVRRKHIWWWTMGMTWDYINLRGLDNLMLDLMWEQDWVHKMMKLLSEGIMHRLDFLQENGLLASNCEGTYVGSGGFGWTDELKKPAEVYGHVTTQDMWGFCDSQETVGCSPETFGEFILPYQIPILERFGLNCYGCCEPLNLRWDYVKKIPNLRRVSTSPWANKPLMAEYLGKNYVMSAKPSPSPLATPDMDEDVVRRDIREILDAAVPKGCPVEIIMKDNHTLGHNPRNITRWVEIAREEIARS